MEWKWIKMGVQCFAGDCCLLASSGHLPQKALELTDMRSVYETPSNPIKTLKVPILATTKAVKKKKKKQSPAREAHN